ncbi:MAG: hypothetical protein K2H90_04725 [Oscillospiraceae bacterium]|nr:hypothetical protein [Oscillospiraceae bacterium]
MDNFETTETKKKIHIGISDIFVFVILAIILGFLIYLKAVDRELFLFGYVWYPNYIGFFSEVLMFAWLLLAWIGAPKSKKRRNVIIVCAVMLVLEAGLIVWSVYDHTKNTADTERITLSDGSEIILHERVTYSKFGEKKFEYTYMDVYQINGITSKKLGRIDETYFSNKCLSQDKYTYEYDEAGKKLTVICEYGTYGDSVVRLKEEYDTGFLSKEFTLE